MRYRYFLSSIKYHPDSPDSYRGEQVSGTFYRIKSKSKIYKKRLSELILKQQLSFQT